MTRSKGRALAALAGMALAVGVLLYLATTLEASPDVGVWIALGAVLIAGAVPLIASLAPLSAEAQDCNER